MKNRKKAIIAILIAVLELAACYGLFVWASKHPTPALVTVLILLFVFLAYGIYKDL